MARMAEPCLPAAIRPLGITCTRLAGPAPNQPAMASVLVASMLALARAGGGADGWGASKMAPHTPTPAAAATIAVACTTRRAVAAQSRFIEKPIIQKYDCKTTVL